VSGRVFICHASENAATAWQVVELLEAAGTECWIAPRNIPVGADFTSSILDGLGAAPAVVLIFSSAANVSPHVRRELETAIGRDTPLLPVRVEGVDPSPSLRYFIGTSQWLDTVGLPVTTWGPALVAGIARITGQQPPTAEPPPVLARPPKTLPPLTGTTWGREALVTEVCSLLEGGGPVTLTGIGGVGKTRLAAEVAARVAGLDVVDDAEPASLRASPAAGSGAPVLATSRVALGVPDERVVLVPPLDDESSVLLFGEVARRAAPSLDVDAQADRIAEVCRLLGGLPLGLILAAGRLRVVGLDRLHSGLTTSLDLVNDLGTALEWSLARLDEPHSSLIQRLANLSGTMSLEAVEGVAERPDAIDLLTGLVDAGLVVVTDGATGPRYALPHPVRLLARRDLENGDHADEAHRAAAAYFLGRTEDWRRRLDTVAGPQVNAEFTAAAPDVEAAVRAAVLSGRTDAAYDLLVSAERLWLDAGRPAEPQALCEELLTTLPPGDPHEARLHAILGRLAYQRTEWSDAERELRRAWELGTQAGDDVAVLNARIYLSGTLMMLGKLDEGRQLAQEVYAETEASGLYPQSAEGLFMLGLSHLIAGNVDEERRVHERRLDVVRAHGDVTRTADQLNTLAEIALDEEEPDKARRYAEESLAISADHFPIQHRDATITLARATAVLGDHAAAGRILADALAASGRHGQSLATAQCLRVAGVLAEAGGSPALAIRLFAAAQALSPSPTGTNDPPEVDLAAALGRAREALEGRAVEHEWTLGGALPLATMLTQLDEAIALNGS
jgi:predicted ATPase